MDCLDAPLFKAMINNGYLNLRKHLEEVNDLNVFPVPDGDTGSNMDATMRGGVDALASMENDSVSALAESMAGGMLLSARGNSGVILSQFFFGLSKSLSGYSQPNVLQFASAMEEGVKKAYSVVVKPVEGTILTVMKEGCLGAKAQKKEAISFADYFTVLIASMKESLRKTPELLPVLKEAGVIDSGGAGLVYIVEGMGQAIGGKIIEDVSLDLDKRSANKIDFSAFNEDSVLDYGYCTEFILQLTTSKGGPARFDLKECIAYLQGLGDSIVALREGNLVKVHVHTKTPEKAIEYARGFGEFITFKMENMTLQHNETLIDKSRHRAFLSHPLGKKELAIIAVAPNEIIAGRFKDYGAAEVINGGETMNPSSKDFLQAMEKAGAKTVLVLPNNKNEIMVAKQACDAFKNGKGYVLETEDLAQGVAAISVMDADNLPLEQNLNAAKDALAHALSLKIGKATKSSNLDGIKIEPGEYVGFINGKACCSAASLPEALGKLFENVEDVEDKEVLTAFFGEGVDEKEKLSCVEKAKEQSDFLEVYPLDGGQKVYQFIGLLE